MMIARVLRLLLVLAQCPLIGYAADLTPAEKIIVEVLESSRTSDDGRSIIPPDISLIPPEQMAAVISRLQETAKLKGGNSLLGTVVLHVMTADLLLLRLGDTFTIERMVNDYRAYDGMTSWGYVASRFRYSRQPKIIPYLAADFYLEEDPSKGITVSPPPGSTEFAVGVPARSIFSAVMVTDLVKSAPGFSAEMKAWANQTFALRLESPERFRALMRTWWEVNKAAFEREDYQAVVPVAEHDAPPSTTTSTPKPVPPPQTAPPASPAPSTPVTQTPAATVERPAIAWPWLVGIAALVVIALRVWKRRG